MTSTASEFWKRLSTVSLVSAEQLAGLQHKFDEIPSAADGGKWIAEQLVAGKVLSTYQARVLLGDGPVRFDYGPYRIVNYYPKGFRAGTYCAVHRPSRHAIRIPDSLCHNTSRSHPRRWQHKSPAGRLRRGPPQRLPSHDAER